MIKFIPLFLHLKWRKFNFILKISWGPFVFCSFRQNPFFLPEWKFRWGEKNYMRLILFFVPENDEIIAVFETCVWWGKNHRQNGQKSPFLPESIILPICTIMRFRRNKFAFHGERNVFELFYFCMELALSCFAWARPLCSLSKTFLRFLALMDVMLDELLVRAQLNERRCVLKKVSCFILWGRKQQQKMIPTDTQIKFIEKYKVSQFWNVPITHPNPLFNIFDKTLWRSGWILKTGSCHMHIRHVGWVVDVCCVGNRWPFTLCVPSQGLGTAEQSVVAGQDHKLSRLRHWRAHPEHYSKRVRRAAMHRAHHRTQGWTPSWTAIRSCWWTQVGSERVTRLPSWLPIHAVCSLWRRCVWRCHMSYCFVWGCVPLWDFFNSHRIEFVGSFCLYRLKVAMRMFW